MATAFDLLNEMTKVMTGMSTISSGDPMGENKVEERAGSLQQFVRQEVMMDEQEEDGSSVEGEDMDHVGMDEFTGRFPPKKEIRCL